MRKLRALRDRWRSAASIPSTKRPSASASPPASADASAARRQRLELFISERALLSDVQHSVSRLRDLSTLSARERAPSAAPSAAAAAAAPSAATPPRDDEPAPHDGPCFELCTFPSALHFPLSEAVVIEIFVATCCSQLLPLPFVTQLLARQKELLESLPNVTQCTPPADGRLTIVGDLHGQFADLLYIFRSNGLPSASNLYIFNGDFVDRGDYGTEIALALFALHQLHPEHVFLNRGNHEERSVHSIFGFNRECTRKYGAATYDAFADVFDLLPLACIVSRKLLVLHAGIDDETSLEALRQAPRTKYVVNASACNRSNKPQLIHPAMRDRIESIRKRDRELRPINSALWNDPMQLDGVSFNKERGTGFLYGADVVRRFLESSGLELIIRSHEQVPNGWQWPFSDGELLATVFSASNYAGRCGNLGAYCVFEPGQPPSGGGGARADATGATYRLACGSLRFASYSIGDITALQRRQWHEYKLASLVYARGAELEAAWRSEDESGAGMLPAAAWAAATRRALQLPDGYEEVFVAAGGGEVDYAAYRRAHQLAMPALEPLFALRELFLTLMVVADDGGEGALSFAAFAEVCAVLHARFPTEAEVCADPAALLGALGPIGDAALREGYVLIPQLVAMFTVSCRGYGGADTWTCILERRLDFESLAVAASQGGFTPHQLHVPEYHAVFVESNRWELGEGEEMDDDAITLCPGSPPGSPRAIDV